MLFNTDIGFLGIWAHRIDGYALLGPCKVDMLWAVLHDFADLDSIKHKP